MVQNGIALSGIDALSGQLRWVRSENPDVSQQTQSAVTLQGNMVYYYDAQHLYAVDAHTSKLLWTSPPFTDAAGSSGGFQQVTYQQGTIYVAMNNTFAAFDSAHGKLLWQKQEALMLIPTTSYFG